MVGFNGFHTLPLRMRASSSRHRASTRSSDTKYSSGTGKLMNTSSAGKRSYLSLAAWNLALAANAACFMSARFSLLNLPLFLYFVASRL